MRTPGDDPEPPAPERENPDHEDFDDRDRKVSDQLGEVGQGSEDESEGD
jgi:hypothetical protein